MFLLMVAQGLSAVAAAAQDGPRNVVGTPAQQMQALKKQYADECAAIDKAKTHARSPIDRRDEPAAPNLKAFCDLMIKIAKDHPSNPERCSGLAWVTDMGSEEQVAEAARLLIRDHLTDPNIGEFCIQALHPGTASSVPTEALQTIVTKNHFATARAVAAYALANRLLETAEKGRIARELDPIKQRRYAQWFSDPAAANSLKKIDSMTLEREACMMLDRILSDPKASAARLSFPETDGALPHEVDGLPNTVGGWAAHTLFEFNHLKKGKPVPDIIGEDIQGRRMKLSDYRGKVVILQFGESWDGVDDGQLLKQSVSNLYLDRGAEFVGVFRLGDRDRLKRMIEKDKIPWRSFWDGGNESGRIHREWHALPGNLAGLCAFIIDHRGNFFARLSQDEHEAGDIAEAVRAARAEMPLKTQVEKP
jgi:hypothetical protein